MDNFKLELYRKNSNDPFPEYTTLDKDDAENLVAEIRSILNISDEVSLFQSLIGSLRNEDFDDEYTINLGQIFFDFNLDFKSEVFLIWDYDEIDFFRCQDLIQYWEHVWYADSDEAVILYFRDLKQLILITDFNRIYWNDK